MFLHCKRIGQSIERQFIKIVVKVSAKCSITVILILGENSNLGIYIILSLSLYKDVLILLRIAIYHSLHFIENSIALTCNP